MPSSDFITMLPSTTTATTNPIIKPTAKPNSSITESNSLSGNGGGDSFLDGVSSPDFSNVNVDISFVNQVNQQQPFVQGCNNSNFDQESFLIDSIVQGKALPQKGKLLKAVLDAGPLLQNLLVAGPLPTWRNPPTVNPPTFQVPPVSIKGRNQLHSANMIASASQPPVPPPSPPRFGPSHWDPLVIALAGLMCTIFLILSLRKIIQHHCNDFIPTRLSRNSVRRRMLIDSNILDDPSLQFQSRGLDSFVMHSLPITQFQKTTKKKEKEKEEEVVGEESTECSICLGEFEDGEWIKHLSNCSHVFHVSCIDTWFQTHSSCPVCRSYVYPETSHETSISVEDLPERREEINRNNSRNFQVLRTHLLQSSPIRLEILQVHDVHHLR